MDNNGNNNLNNNSENITDVKGGNTQSKQINDCFSQQQGNGYYNNNQSSNGYYNNNQSFNGYYNNNQSPNGYYNNNQSSNGYYNNNQGPNGYYNNNPNPNNYYNNGQYAQRVVYPNNPAPVSQAEIRAEKKEFNFALIKLAVFAMIVVLNTNFLMYVFYYPAYFLAQSLSESSYTVIYLISWIANDLCAYMIPGLSAFLLFRKELKAKIQYPRHPNASTALNSGLTFFAACFLGSVAGLITNAIAAFMDRLFGTGEIPDAMENSVPPQGEIGSFFIMFFFVVVAAPVIEELIFRKLLLNPLRRYGDWFAIIITALMFGFYHGNFDQMPYAFVVGMMFALLAVNTNSVIPSMVLHILNNLLVTLSQYMVDVTGETEPAMSIASWLEEALGLSFWIGIPAVALMIAGKMFKTAHKAALTPKDKAGLIFKNPAFYVFVIFTVLMMVDLY